jgi:hypothetical protein
MLQESSLGGNYTHFLVRRQATGKGQKVECLTFPASSA